MVHTESGHRPCEASRIRPSVRGLPLTSRAEPTVVESQRPWAPLAGPRVPRWSWAASLEQNVPRHCCAAPRNRGRETGLADCRNSATRIFFQGNGLDRGGRLNQGLAAPSGRP